MAGWGDYWDEDDDEYERDWQESLWDLVEGMGWIVLAIISWFILAPVAGWFWGFMRCVWPWAAVEQ